MIEKNIKEDKHLAKAEVERLQKQAEVITSKAEIKAEEITKKAEGIVQKAESKAQEITKKADVIVSKAEKDAEHQQKKIDQLETKLTQKEEKLDQRIEKLDEKKEELATKKKDLDEMFAKQETILSDLSGLSPADAKKQLFDQIEQTNKDEIKRFINKRKTIKEEEAKEEA